MISIIKKMKQSISKKVGTANLDSRAGERNNICEPQNEEDYLG